MNHSEIPQQAEHGGKVGKNEVAQRDDGVPLGRMIKSESLGAHQQQLDRR